MKSILKEILKKATKFVYRRKFLSLTLIAGLLLVFSTIAVLWNFKLLPNSDIFEANNTSIGIFENINPEFNVLFGDKEDTSKQWIRFESETSDSNEFDSNYKAEKKTLLEKVKDLFSKDRKLGIEMSLNEVKLSETGNETIKEMTGEEQSVSDVLGTSDVQTSTELVQTGRNLGELDNEQNISKETILNENVWNGVDLEYQILEGIGVKEEIIIRSLESYMSGCESSETGCEYPLNEFVFDLQLDEGVELHQSLVSVRDNPVGTYYFTDSQGNYLAHFLPSFAFDNSGSTTNDVEFYIEETGEEGRYKVHVILDMDWLLDESRVFPIHIDPSIVHDDNADFSAGKVLNRLENVTGPKVELKGRGLASDSYTVGLWHLDEVSGSTMADSSSYGNNGTATGTTIVSGIFNNARDFNGSSDIVTISDKDSFTFGNGLVDYPFSIEAWVKFDDATSRTIISKYTTSPSNLREWILYTTSSDVLRLQLFDNSNGYYISRNTEAITNYEGEWIHVSATYNGNGSDSGIAIYINGVRADSSSTTSGTYTAMENTSKDVIIGNYTSTAYFDGTIDEVRISNIARTEAEIYKSYKTESLIYYGTYISDAIDLTADVSSINYLQWIETGVSTGDGETPFSSTNLVGEWKFNETSGTTATNTGTCGSNCNGTLTNMTTSAQDAGVLSGWTSVNRRWGTGALMFDGSNDYVSLGSNAALSLTTYSIGGWFKTSDFSDYKVLVNKGTSTTASNMWITVWKTGVSGHPSGSLVWRASSGGVASVIDLGSKVNVADGKWHYFAAVLNGSTSASLYLDGVLVDYDSTISTVDTPSTATILGNDPNASGRYFKGTLDSFRFYSRALTASEVLSNYNAGNIEFLTSTSSDGTTWEAWKPSTGETQISSMDSVKSSWSWDISGIFTPVFKENETTVKTEGSGSLDLQYISSVDPTKSDILALYHFDETNGNNAGYDLFDATANSKDGEFNGSNIATAVTDGISGKARTFNGTNDYVEIPLGNGFTNIYTTISLWIYPTSWTHQTHTVLFASRTTITNGIMLLVYNQTSLQLDWDGNNYRWNTGYLPPLNTWTNIVIVRDYSGRYLYVNGVLQNSTTSAGSSVTTDIKFRIGADTMSNQYNYQGKIDEFWVSNVAKSPEEIAEIYRSGKENYLKSTISSTDLSGNDKVIFSIAADRPGIYLAAVLGESNFANYLADDNTIGMWHLEEQTSELLQTTTSTMPTVNSGTGTDGDIYISANTDINATNSISGRSCSDGGDAVNYNVSSLTSNTATVSTGAISSGCIVAGDEVLLINLAGSTSSIVNLGKYETLTVQSVSNATGVVTFTTSKTNYYGSGSGNDTGLGTANETQRVMLQRVPNYRNVTIASSYTLSPTAWNGSKGGVLFFRASGVVNVIGSISAVGKGYRGGAYVGTTYGGAEGEGAAIGSSATAGHGGDSTNPSTAGTTGVWSGGGGGGKYGTAAGSSGGSGSSNAASSGGGGGGSAARYSTSYHGYAGGGGGGGHATGGGGAIGNGSSVCTGNAGCSGTSSGSGAGGTANVSSSYNRGGGGGGGSAMYYSQSLDNLTFGGGGGGGARGQGSSGSYYAGSDGGNGGGIVFISANTLSVTGTITANGSGSSSAGTCGGTGGAGAGGSVKLYSNVADLGSSLVTASGGTASTTGGGDGGDGGSGVVAIYSSTYFTGSTTPTYYYSGRFNILSTGTTVVPGVLGNARSFAGTATSYISSYGISNFPTSAITVDYWIKTSDTTKTGTAFSYAVGTTYNAFTIYNYQNIQLYVNDSSVSTGVSVNDGNWHYIAVTWQSSNGQILLYKDGTLEYSGTISSGTPLTTGGIVVLGQDQDSLGGTFSATEALLGYLDEVRVSNVVRSAEDIRQSYEVANRSYTITVDFKASLSSGNLITGSGDTSFTIDSRTYGAVNMGDNLYIGDKIVIKEVVNDSEYIAQGTVSDINTTTGAATVSSWDSGSTFPSGGYTVNATVFKWQTEYFDVTKSLSSQRNAVTSLVFRFIDSSQGAEIWLDDIRYTTGYLTDPSATGNVTSTLARYIRYKAIFTTTDEDVTPYISQVTINYEAQTTPAMSALMRHGKWFNSSGVEQPFWWAK